MELKSKQLGHFQIRGPVGRSDICLIYLAIDTRDNQEVFLIIPDPRAPHEPEFLQRFLQQGQAAIQLQHPNLAQVRETGQLEQYYYVALDAIPGVTLANALRQRNSPMPPDETADIINQVAAALDYAHDQGFLHQNLTPNDIWLTRDGLAVVTGMGLARRSTVQVGSAGAYDGETLVSPVHITPFLAPEQARGEVEIDRRADVYSLGAIAYAMLVGRPPFDEGDQLLLLNEVIHGTPPAPEVVTPNVPAGMAFVLKFVLSKEANLRYAKASEFATALNQGKMWRASAVSTTSSSISSLTRNAPVGSTRPWGRRLAGVAALLVLILGIGAVATGAIYQLDFVSSIVASGEAGETTPVPAATVALATATPDSLPGVKLADGQILDTVNTPTPETTPVDVSVVAFVDITATATITDAAALGVEMIAPTAVVTAAEGVGVAGANAVFTATAAVALIPTETPSPAPTDTATAAPTDTATATPVATDTPLPTPTAVPAATVTPTELPLPPTNTPTTVPTNPPLPTAPPTATPTTLPTDTPAPTPTNTSVPTDTPAPTHTPIPTDTAVPTATNTPLPTNTLAPTATNTPIPAATATNTPAPTATNTPRPTNTPAPTATNTPQPPTSTPTNTATSTRRPTNTPTSIRRPTNTPTKTPLPLPTPTNTPADTPTPIPTATPTLAPTPTIVPLLVSRVTLVQGANNGWVARITGQVEPGSTVQALVDNQPANAVQVRDNGAWTLNVPLSNPGEYEVSVVAALANGTRLQANTPPALVVVPTPAPPAPPAGNVQLVDPGENAGGGGNRSFSWQADFAPGEGQGFELIFWRFGQDPMVNGFGLASPTTGNSVSVDLDALDEQLGATLDPGEYQWGVLLVQTSPYQRLRFLGDSNKFNFAREGDSGGSSGGGDGGGGGGSSGE